MKKFLLLIVISLLICSLFIIATILFPNIIKAQETEDWQILFNGQKYKNGYTLTLSSLGVNGNHIMLNGTFTNHPESLLMLSDDSCKTWRESKILIDTSFKTIFAKINSTAFPDTSTIYIHIDSTFFKGYDGLNAINNYLSCIYKSTDFGISWETIIIGEKLRSRPSKIMSMQDNLNGVLLQYPDKDEEKDIIWFTNDGWKSWKKINTPDGIIASESMKLINNKIYILVNFKSSEVYSTKDFGKSWEVISIPSEFTKDKWNTKLLVLNDSIFYCYGFHEKYQGDSERASFIIKTTNSGQSWKKIFGKSYLNATISDIVVIDENKLIALGDSVFRTNDGFQNWTSFKVYLDESSYPLYKLIHINENLEYGICGSYLLNFTGGKTLLPPTFTEPENSSANPLDFTVKWTPIIGANRYHLQIVERNPSMFKETFDSTLFVNDSLITDTSFQLTGTKYYKEYACRIRAMSNTQKSSWIEGYWITNNDTTAVVENKNDIKSTIYPNPANDLLFINVSQLNGRNTDYIIFSIEGSIIQSGKFNNKIDISNLKTGFYLIKLNGKVSKFIKI